MYLNRLTLIGFTGGDAETKTLSNGSTFAAFSMATQRSWKNPEGAWESRTEWHRCVSFGKLADFAATLKKGAHVQVEGELRGRESEKERNAVSIVAHALQQAGILSYSRGQIEIIDIAKLQATACECYHAAKAKQDRLLK